MYEMRCYRKIKKIVPAKHQTPVILGSNYNIGFVCTGNICRSTFAEHYARKFNPNNTYFSFGTVVVDNRLSPVNAVKPAANFNVDISTCLSSAYDKNKALGADYIFVMDKRNFYDLKELGFPEEKIFFLNEEEIGDPYGKPVKYFDEVYRKIAETIEKKIPLL